MDTRIGLVAPVVVGIVLTAIFAAGFTATVLSVRGASAQEPNIDVAILGSPVRDPSGTYSVIWRGQFIDLRMPGVSTQYPVAALQRQVWTQLIFENASLPIELKFDGREMLVKWHEVDHGAFGNKYKEIYDNYWCNAGFC